eukprot:GHVS01022460.1.p1 GENE.GHVS01022460.1~~GHVS01022460.1.p1  ORF type:complete len:134 (-),score=24.82 GHVS01022460.1:347-748(-)
MCMTGSPTFSLACVSLLFLPVALVMVGSLRVVPGGCLCVCVRCVVFADVVLECCVFLQREEEEGFRECGGSSGENKVSSRSAVVIYRLHCRPDLEEEQATIFCFVAAAAKSLHFIYVYYVVCGSPPPVCEESR